ncbi:hypothetical protein PCE1_004500 [Barthelona sp. PCE]
MCAVFRLLLLCSIAVLCLGNTINYNIEEGNNYIRDLHDETVVLVWDKLLLTVSLSIENCDIEIVFAKTTYVESFDDFNVTSSSLIAQSNDITTKHATIVDSTLINSTISSSDDGYATILNSTLQTTVWDMQNVMVTNSTIEFFFSMNNHHPKSIFFARNIIVLGSYAEIRLTCSTADMSQVHSIKWIQFNVDMNFFLLTDSQIAGTNIILYTESIPKFTLLSSYLPFITFSNSDDRQVEVAAIIMKEIRTSGMEFVGVRVETLKMINMPVLNEKSTISLQRSVVITTAIIRYTHFLAQFPEWEIHSSAAIEQFFIIDSSISQISLQGKFILPDAQFVRIYDSKVSDILLSVDIHDESKAISELFLKNVTFENSVFPFSSDRFILEDVTFNQVLFTRPLHLDDIKRVVITNSYNSPSSEPLSLFVVPDITAENITVRDCRLQWGLFEFGKGSYRAKRRFSNLFFERVQMPFIVYTADRVQVGALEMALLSVMNSTINHLVKTGGQTLLSQLHFTDVIIISSAMDSVVENCVSNAGILIDRPFVSVSNVTVFNSSYHYFLGMFGRIGWVEISELSLGPVHNSVFMVIDSVDRFTEDFEVEIADSTILIPDDSVLVFHVAEFKHFNLTMTNMEIATMPSMHPNVIYPFMIYSTSFMLNQESVRVNGTRNIVADKPFGYSKNGYAQRIGVNTIDKAEIQLIIGQNSLFEPMELGHQHNAHFAYITQKPFSFGMINVDEFSVRLPLSEFNILSKELRVAFFETTGVPIFTGVPEKVACRAGYGWDAVAGKCQACSIAYHQFELVNEPQCFWDEKQANLTDMQRYGISGFVYSNDDGYFVVEANNTAYLIDCYNSFCTGRADAGVSGRAFFELDAFERDLYHNNDASGNGCVLGHYSTACTKCVPYQKIDGVEYEGYFNLFNQGCVIIPMQKEWLVLVVFLIHVVMVWMAIKFYYLVGHVPWTRVFKAGQDSLFITDFEAFEIINVIKDFAIILWPLIFASNNLDVFLRDTNHIDLLLKLLVNPLSNFSVTFSFLDAVFPYVYLLLFCSLFFKIPYKIFFTALVVLAHAVIGYIAFVLHKYYIGVGIIGLIAWSVCLFIKKQPNFLLKILWFSAYFVTAILFSGIARVLCVILPLLMHLSWADKPKTGKIISFNFFFLPYTTKLVFLRTIPFVSYDIYGIMSNRYFHTLSDFNTPYNPLNLILIATYFAFFYLCYRQTERVVSHNQSDYRAFFYMVLIGRTLFTFVSYVSHTPTPNQTFLVAILLYIVFVKPFHQLNVFMLKVTSVMVILSFIIVLYSTLSTSFFFIVLIPVIYVIFQSITHNPTKKKNINAFLDYDQVL